MKCTIEGDELIEVFGGFPSKFSGLIFDGYQDNKRNALLTLFHGEKLILTYVFVVEGVILTFTISHEDPI